MTTLSADDSLLSHYGFSHDPFATRVPGFKFFPAQRKPVLGQLHHLARYSQLLLVVTGPEGSGKTLVRQALVASSNKQAVQSIVVTPQGTADSGMILQQVALALNLQTADFDAIMAQIVQLALTGQEIYLLVDDAGRLTGAAIETLLRLAAGTTEARPHVFLFGEPSLVARLDALVEGEERFHVISLQPYTAEETREYLALRLEGAGSGLECLSDEQVGRIHEHSGGWPGAINQAARDELIDAMVAVKAGEGGGMRLPLPAKHLVAVAVVLCVIGVALTMRSGQEQVVAPTTLRLPLGGAPAEATGSADVAAPVLAGPAQPIIREPLAAAAGAADEDPQLVEVSASRAPAPAPVQAVSSAPRPAPVQLASSAPRPAPAPVVAPARAAVAEPVAAVRPIVARTAPAEPAATAGSWYAIQPGSNYVLQIVGTQAETNAQALVRKYGSNYRYFVKLHQGKPLYVVTFGNFATRAAALGAIKTLPAELQSGKPWARTFASVNKEITQSR